MGRHGLFDFVGLFRQYWGRMPTGKRASTVKERGRHKRGKLKAS
jgi:hypothetical protein